MVERVVLGMLLAISGAAAAPAADPEPPAVSVDELRAGLRGWGETVFAGSATERFDVEILGVLRNVSPGTDAVLARLSGHGLESSGVVAGMSGSPIWIDGRLVGAVAFAWPFASEAIAGITPIAAMREIPRAAPAAPPAGGPVVTWSDLLARRLPAELLEAAARQLVGGGGLDGRGAVIWGVSGFTEVGLDRLARALPALAPVAAGSVETRKPVAELAAGSSVAAVFVDGDLRLAAVGTVTERVGDRILAFGHPVAGLGEVSLPMAPAEVVTVMPSRYSSFKLANSGAVVGEFVRDHSAGGLGRLGAAPRTVPLTIRVAGQEAREFQLRLAWVPRLLPLLAAVGTIGALDVATSAAGSEGLDLDLTADLGGRGTVELRQSFDGPGAADRGVLFLYAVLDFLARTDLAEVEIRGLSVGLTPSVAPRTKSLVGAHAARSVVEPGESLELFVDLRGWRGAMERRTLRVPISADLPAGRYTLLVGDGVSLDAARQTLEPVEPVTFDQAAKLLAELGSARELGVVGVLPGRGLTVAGEVLPRLPGSARAIWSAGGGGGTRPLRLAVVQRERFAEPSPVAGLVKLEVEIRRPQPMTGEASPAPAPGEGAPPGAAGAPASPPGGSGGTPAGSQEDR